MGGMGGYGGQAPHKKRCGSSRSVKRKKIEVQKRELVERKESKKEINSSESKQTKKSQKGCRR